jgi:hypothetical protein
MVMNRAIFGMRSVYKAVRLRTAIGDGGSVKSS